MKNNIFTTLDVGCGEDYHGTVNTDLYPHDASRSRYCGKNGFQRNLNKIPNFVKSDINNLPFQDDAFKIVICSHLLEHVGVNTITACKELLRVAKDKVIIRVPSHVSVSRHTPSHNVNKNFITQMMRTVAIEKMVVTLFDEISNEIRKEKR